jgi:hypothetical protein
MADPYWVMLHLSKFIKSSCVLQIYHSGIAIGCCHHNAPGFEGESLNSNLKFEKK